MPALIFMLAFIGYPVMNNLVLSFQDVNVMTVSSKTKEFIGLQNYVTLIKDPVLRISVFNTFYYSIACIFFQFVIGFSLALLFNQKFSLRSSLRGCS